MKKRKRWYDYLWIWTIAYFVLGFFNILFAWLGMVDFLLPLLIAIFGGNKFFCNHLCGRGQLLTVLPAKFGVSGHKPAPAWLRSAAFRYGFLAFFLAMFGNSVATRRVRSVLSENPSFAATAILHFPAFRSSSS